MAKHGWLYSGILAALAAAPAARAELIWQGIPAQGTGQFKIITSEGNCGEGSITAVNDPQRGSVWRYHKPAAGNRCENHGIRVNNAGYAFREGAAYYFGWWSKLSTTANNNANFQWKSYENHIQNFPVILKMISGRMHLRYRDPQGRENLVWSAPISAHVWYHYVVALHLSKDATRGTIEFWFNGVKQTLTGGGQSYFARTYDSGNHNCPKWGIYGGRGTEMTNWISDLKVGTDYASVGIGATPVWPGLLPRLAPAGQGRAYDLLGRDPLRGLRDGAQPPVGPPAFAAWR